ncbi:MULTISPECIES: hypothetical protein [Ralstonia]|jgi:flagellar protein FlgJ|uniref:Flagellar protein FlgJ N-terminal domain-containing protein n=1 Tax=Ralstonia flaminis TaxID=3058597 RepID=A0ABM9K901_9RALS|nr:MULTISPECIES: hypothetical protein [unclassified Ralstonia]CAJ0819383.1 hypothetical protein LMG18101_03929 [Ralstonia sp. LMG 18101]
MTHDFMPISRASNSATGADASAIRPAEATDRQKIEAAAVQFEGMFIAQMLNEMKKATDQLKADNGFDDKSSDSMLDYANRVVADAIAHQRAFGIADTLVAQMLPRETASTND